MKLVRHTSLKETKTNHSGILKKVFLENGYIPNLTGFNLTILKPGQTIENHEHKTMFEIFYVLSGKLHFKVGDNEVELEANDLISVEPGEIHSLENKSQSEVKFIYFGII